MNIKRLLPLGAVAAMLGSCATYHSAGAGQLDPADFGEANRQTYAAMIIDPDPEYTEDMETSGEHASDAVERYREGTVKQPVSQRTTAGPR